MLNNIMAAGSMDRPPMLATGQYPQWRLRFLRYIDTRPNGKALRKCILSGPYKPTTVLVQAVEATNDSLAIPEHTIVETPMNMSPKNKTHLEAEKEVIHLILTGIGDKIYSTIDACQTAQEMWEAIKRLQQGESLNIQDVKTNLFWEFVNVQFLQQLKLEWSRFVTIVKQQHKLDEVSYHKLFDILKQYQNEVNELRAKRLTRNANPLALVATAQANQDPYYQTSRTVNVAGTRENVGSLVVQQSGIQCFNCKEFRHFAKEFRKPKWVKDSVYHKEKMMLCKQAEQDLKAIKKANTTLAQELKECKTILAETSKSLGESISVRDSCLVALQTKPAEFEKYKAFNDHTIDYDKLERKLNNTLGQLALKDIEIKEGLKTKAYEISVIKEKHDELMKQSLLTKSHYKGLVNQKTKVITDLKLREEHDSEKMLSMEKQLKFLNEIVYKRSQSIQTIHMMAPKVPTYNGRPTFANSRYLK
nr:hypothetical protein [Tanacetum cinerariifolium]